MHDIQKIENFQKSTFSFGILRNVRISQIVRKFTKHRDKWYKKFHEYFMNHFPIYKKAETSQPFANIEKKHRDFYC